VLNDVASMSGNSIIENQATNNHGVPQTIFYDNNKNVIGGMTGFQPRFAAPDVVKEPSTPALTKAPQAQPQPHLRSVIYKKKI
jgi:hypothetical protein